MRASAAGRPTGSPDSRTAGTPGAASAACRARAARRRAMRDDTNVETKATGTMGTRRAALDRENLAHPVEEPVGTPE